MPKRGAKGSSDTCSEGGCCGITGLARGWQRWMAACLPGCSSFLVASAHVLAQPPPFPALLPQRQAAAWQG